MVQASSSPWHCLLQMLPDLTNLCQEVQLKVIRCLHSNLEHVLAWDQAACQILYAEIGIQDIPHLSTQNAAK